MAAPGVPARPANARIHHVGIYDIGEPKIEYDYVLQTNNLGFAQDRDLECSRPTTAFLGDSFTEGQGAPAWFAGIEPDAPAGRQLANLGYLGTGMLNWQAALAHYAPCLAPDRLVFVFISHDWYRPIFEISSSQIDCLAGTGACREPEHLWYPLKPGDKPSDLIERTTTRYEARWKGRDSLRDRLSRWEIWPKRHIYVFALLRNAAVAYLGLGGMESRADTLETFERSKAAFLSMVASVGRENVRLLMIPQADEVIANSPNPRSRAVRAFLDAQGMPVQSCELAIGDFLPNDRHPNAGGYAKIAACARKLI
ncbi:MAG: hypothetical protein GC202_11810 [Alphaproteobacteria bacterium]|nr:hypothetical protein [Alphaproteobacteria bacterium]